MRSFIVAAVAFSALAIGSGAHAEDACMTAHDLAWSPSIARALPVIGVAGKGCVTGEQIAKYKAALKQARTEEKARVAELIKG